MCLFSLAAFKVFSLSFVFSSLTILWLGMFVVCFVMYSACYSLRFSDLWFGICYWSFKFFWQLFFKIFVLPCSISLFLLVSSCLFVRLFDLFLNSWNFFLVFLFLSFLSLCFSLIFLKFSNSSASWIFWYASWRHFSSLLLCFHF